MLPHLIHGTKQKNKTSNIIDSVSLGFGASSLGDSPLGAPDSDFLHWLDFSDPARTVDSGGFYDFLLAPKTGVIDATTSYNAAGGANLPETGGTINALPVGNFPNSQTTLMAFNSLTYPNLLFKYPSMTVFIIVQPKYAFSSTGGLLSDVGSSGLSLFLIKAGRTNGAVSVQLTDAAAQTILVISNDNVVSLDVTSLIVAKCDGANRRVDFWVDGANNPYSGVNPAYDNTNTWEGRAGGASSSVPTTGVTAFSRTGPYYGYIGCIFVTKTALSNADINKYANWIATKWGTVWIDI